MKITAFDDAFPGLVATGGTTIGYSSGSNSAAGDSTTSDVVGSPGDYSVVGLRRQVSLASNVGGTTIGDVLTIVGTSPRLAMFSTPSNSALSYASNSTRVSEVSLAGVSTSVSRADHQHDGIGTITASSSNTMQRGTLNLRSGAGIALSLADSDGDGELDTATIVNTGASALAASGAVVLRSATQSIAASTDVAVDFTAADTTDTDGYHNPASNSTRIVIPSGLGGLFFTIIGSFTFAASLGGTERIAKLRKNGTTVIAEQTEQGLVNADLAMQVSATYPLADGDYIELIAWQDGVGAINVQAGATLHIARNGGPAGSGGGGGGPAFAVRNDVAGGFTLVNPTPSAETLIPGMTLTFTPAAGVYRVVVHARYARLDSGTTRCYVKLDGAKIWPSIGGGTDIGRNLPNSTSSAWYEFEITVFVTLTNASHTIVLNGEANGTTGGRNWYDRTIEVYGPL